MTAAHQPVLSSRQNSKRRLSTNHSTNVASEVDLERQLSRRLSISSRCDDGVIVGSSSVSTAVCTNERPRTLPERTRSLNAKIACTNARPRVSAAERISSLDSAKKAPLGPIVIKDDLLFVSSAAGVLFAGKKDETKSLRKRAPAHDPAKNPPPTHVSPVDCIKSIAGGPSSGTSLLSSVTEKYGTPSFVNPTEDQIASYTWDVTSAVRNGDLSALRSLQASGSTDLECSNRSGERLIHIACRRGNVDIVRYLLRDAKVPLTVRDDFGKTPFHDACWLPTPNYELMDLLIQEGDPRMLLLGDVRGHTPFDYARRDHWEGWVRFLTEREELIQARMGECCAADER